MQKDAVQVCTQTLVNTNRKSEIRKDFEISKQFKRSLLDVNALFVCLFNYAHALTISRIITIDNNNLIKKKESKLHLSLQAVPCK